MCTSYIHTYILDVHIIHHTYIHTYTHTHTHAYIQTFIHTYICMYVCMYVCTCEARLSCFVLDVPVVHTYLRIYTYVCLHIRCTFEPCVTWARLCATCEYTRWTYILCTPIHTFVQRWYIPPHIHTPIYIHIHRLCPPCAHVWDMQCFQVPHTQLYTHIPIRPCVHTHIYTHIHTHA